MNSGRHPEQRTREEAENQTPSKRKLERTGWAVKEGRRRFVGRSLQNDGPPNRLNAALGLEWLDQLCSCWWGDQQCQACPCPRQLCQDCRRNRWEGGSEGQEPGLVRQLWKVGICKEPGELCPAFSSFLCVLPSLPPLTLCDKSISTRVACVQPKAVGRLEGGASGDLEQG